MDITHQNRMHGNTQANHSLTQYQQLKNEYAIAGITYKSNEVLHKISQIKGYPYIILLEMVKMFHMNQFEVIFFCHILNDDQECPYQDDPNIFETNINLPELIKLYNILTNNGENQIKITRIYQKIQDEDQDQQQKIQQNEGETQYWTLPELKKLYIYLLVIGYSIKYYLNQSIKPYEDEVNRRCANFFATIFHVWVDKYSSKVLRTSPKKINQFYIDLFIADQIVNINNSQLDCQYRNYNQIVQELIKATLDIDDGLHKQDKDLD